MTGIIKRLENEVALEKKNGFGAICYEVHENITADDRMKLVSHINDKYVNIIDFSVDGHIDGGRKYYNKNGCYIGDIIKFDFE